MVVKRIPKMPPDTVTPATTKPRKKTFVVEDWITNDGQRIILYADTGMGKTSLALLAPNPVFIGTDEGGADFYHPETGEIIKRVPNIENFGDIRAAIQQPGLFDAYETVVLDTITIMQDWAIDHVVRTIPTEKGGIVNNILGYGYNKGWNHLYDVMKLLLVDLERLIHQDKNVIIIAQAAIHNVPNPDGENFIRTGLRLHVDKNADTESLYCEWADHLLKIAYSEAKAKEGKITGTTDRAIFTQPKLHFRAKTRPLPKPIPAVVEFTDKADDAIWQWIFQGDE
ncbi:hypothetical protein LCGC14_1771920 [marine sediment metagenome]|uniref:Uncharacterized protein n=1 Tax=marine sediment metagenome TaxID=412755 RepID=A0A0F9GY07_9ZZZZ